jgi:DNA polymerase
MAGNTYRVARDRGKWISVNGRLAMPVFHPAALLRNPDLKRPTWDDYKEVVRKYRELVNANHKSDYV